MKVEGLPFFSVIRREERRIDNLMPLLDDPRTRLLAVRLKRLKRQLEIINGLIDPSVEKINLQFTERQVAMVNKTYLTGIRNKLTSATSKLTVALTNIMDVLFDVDPVIETETNLTENLSKVYRTTVTQIEKIFDAMSKMESTVFPDEILTDTAELRKAWNDLQMLLTNQIVEPLQSSLLELARENALKRLSQMIYGGRAL